MRRLAPLVLAISLFTSCVGQPAETTTSTVTPSSTTTTQPTTSSPDATSTTSTTAPAGIETAVYFFFQGYPVEPGPYVVPVARRTAGDLTGALTALLVGVTEDEAAMGLSSTIPEGTRLLGVDVTDGVAAIDLSGEFESGGGSLSVLGRVAQVVYTATRFDDVEGVEFLIDGVRVEVLSGEGLIVDEPQTRAGYADLTPAILVESPIWGSTVGAEVSLRGQALTQSGTVSYAIVDADGLIVAEGQIPTEEPDGRSLFAESVDLGSVPNPGLGSLIVFELSPDGVQLHVLEYPLTIALD